MAVLFVEWVGPDDMKSSVNIIQLDQMNPVGVSYTWIVNAVERYILKLYDFYALSPVRVVH